MERVQCTSTYMAKREISNQSKYALDYWIIDMIGLSFLVIVVVVLFTVVFFFASIFDQAWKMCGTIYRRSAYTDFCVHSSYLYLTRCLLHFAHWVAYIYRDIWMKVLSSTQWHTLYQDCFVNDNSTDWRAMWDNAIYS